ncbi:MAG: hypothetical protein HOP15_11085 [Planctomycetes bacterium]|nr:hypothetical protein [Planctomycetota bacterium]
MSEYEFDPSGAVASLGAAEAAQVQALLDELGRAAAAFRFEVAPNPCVGACVLSDGVEIGRGYHRAWAGPHAEIEAIEAARASGVSSARWDTLVVTLEPCSSHGKTPPCGEAILREPFRRVVVGAMDPDPRQRGHGLELLRAAGLEVFFVRGGAPLERIAPHFLEWTRPDRLRRSAPWVIAKWAQTRTGQLSPPRGVGDGRQISGTAARARAAHRRARRRDPDWRRHRSGGRPAPVRARRDRPRPRAAARRARLFAAHAADCAPVPAVRGARVGRPRARDHAGGLRRGALPGPVRGGRHGSRLALGRRRPHLAARDARVAVVAGRPARLARGWADPDRGRDRV